MTATRTPGVPVVEDGVLVSTSPATGDEVGRFPVASAAEVDAAVARARTASSWWASLGFDGRRERLLRYRSLLANRLAELADLVHREGGKPAAEAVVEVTAAIDHVAWAARHARRVLGPRRVRGSLLVAEHAAYLEYQPYGVIGVIGPWNYPVFTPMGSIAYALAAGNAVVFKPSEYTPAVGQWLVDRFAEVVPEQPVLQIVHGTGEVGGALCRSGVGKLAFTGSTATGKKVMAACAETLTPVLVECGGKDAMIVEADADLDAAVSACLWGGMTNAGQTCIGIERVYVAERVYDDFLGKLVERAAKLTVSDGEDADFGPITMPGQIDVIRRHIDDAIARGGRAVLGGPDAVQPPYVKPTILVDVPEDSVAVREETFGPTLTVTRVRDGDEAVERANASVYGLGGSVFSRSRGMELARRLRSGMTAVNGALSFAGVPSLPFGGIGDSGFGRIHGEDGLREFARAKAITRRRMPSPLPAMSFDRSPKAVAMIARAVRLVHGRSR
ncbi:aldehyde dehydrogenase family protein [Planosporangium thailandense]|uniref:Aldehyde dehydrogenase n=1 Tax=Planosporangium thailandense TaxID=765197 RepID=A0ABX0Y4P4_9ACTN|nr:aldehyde dehydrogenase family protein [Planosporangium thailandense]NJC73382.1 aldehyde dehydrogenase family protein [Planosporangium thailandense]